MDFRHAVMQDLPQLKDMYKQIIDTLYKIYDCPVGAKIKPQKCANHIGNA